LGLCSPNEYKNTKHGLFGRSTNRNLAKEKAPLKYIYEQPTITSLTKLAAAQEPTVYESSIKNS
jgi:hypothetical protein